MPIIRSAKKKMRQDEKRRKRNYHVRESWRVAVKQAILKKNKKKLAAVQREIDIAAKKSVIHKNKAARLKSRLARLTSL